MVSRASGPYYQQIAADLRGKIRDGTYPPGTQLPSVRDLAGQWDVVERTVLAAVDLLRDEGLAVTRPGRGIFVREQRVPRRLTFDMVTPGELRGWYQTVTKAGHVPTHETRVRREPSSTSVADRLDLEPGDEVAVRDRIMQVEGKPPEMLATSFHPLWVVELIPRLEDPTSGGMVNWHESAGFELDYFDVINSRVPTVDERQKLDLDPGSAVTVITGTTRAQDGRPLYAVDIVAAGDRFEFAYRYGKIPEPPG